MFFVFFKCMFHHIGLLILASQRAETQFIELFGSASMIESLQQRQLHQRGNGPSYIELLILLFVIGNAIVLGISGGRDRWIFFETLKAQTRIYHAKGRDICIEFRVYPFDRNTKKKKKPPRL